MLQQQLLRICNEITVCLSCELEFAKSIIDFIGEYKGSFIYPRVIKRKFKLSMQQAYDILDIFVENNILTFAFEVYCNHCDRFQTNVYNNLDEIEDGLLCEECYKELDKSKDVIVIYKVIKDARR